MRGSVELLLDGLVFAEAPRWHAGRLWCSDIFAQRVVAVDETGSCETMVSFDGDQLPVGLGFLPDGRLLMTNLDRPEVLRLDAPGVVNVHADLSALAVGIVNDMVVDRDGRAYVGSSGARDAGATVIPSTGNVIVVEPDGSARVAADRLWGPNGPAITRDGSYYIVSELPGSTLVAFDRTPDGALHNRRVWADLRPYRADGIAVDAQNAVWTASPAAGVYRRVLEGGEVTDVIDVAGRRAVACALGGADGRTLFLLTNKTSELADAWVRRKFATAPERRAEPHFKALVPEFMDNSRIETVRVDVPAW
ncbi:SMP-30/gluconolactonase/LRE family protein [Dactylosporangium sp. CA-092794]|uniref:SMP-30/gluconolactonase/LRE family protein n=1 Tax=Dactylosporangium sp. CA-092794 TaxID=3239929 RepID=UPI003D8CEC48